MGLIPGPDEPKHDINTYLEPLVEELLLFWKGLRLKVAVSSGFQDLVVKCVLLCVACDLPAVRKVCGFLSCNAAFGCSKCMKRFPGSVGNMNFSGFDRSNWPHRTNQAHRKSVNELKKCLTKSSQAAKESKIGSRYSVLLDLPYFDPVRMHVIDVMHNMFLGTMKHMVKIWIRDGVLLSSHFEKIQECVDSINVPADVGRIPRKIQSGFSAFKADQCKNWINIFSIPALFDILSDDALQIWRYFVLACRILCKQELTLDEINLADSLLLQFCKKVQDTYGESAITPNMHLHGHLKEVTLDYGPLQEYWCFSFERYNGILGLQPTNNRIIEQQLMTKFLRENYIANVKFPERFRDDFENIVGMLTKSKNVHGSLAETFATNNFKLGTKFCRALLPSEDHCFVSALVYKLDPAASDQSKVCINSIFCKYSFVSLKGKVFCSSGKKSKPVVAMVKWEEDIYGLPPTPVLSSGLFNTDRDIRPVDVKYYANITYTIDSVSKEILLAFVYWFSHTLKDLPLENLLNCGAIQCLNLKAYIHLSL